jgi:threonine/homoserine/homoserine lactone efflux protein
MGEEDIRCLWEIWAAFAAASAVLVLIPGPTMLGHAWLVTALNPKSITFFVAFLPAFLDPKIDFFAQMAIMEAFAFINAPGCARAASKARGLVANPRAVGAINAAAFWLPLASRQWR